MPSWNQTQKWKKAHWISFSRTYCKYFSPTIVETVGFVRVVETGLLELQIHSRIFDCRHLKKVNKKSVKLQESFWNCSCLPVSSPQMSSFDTATDLVHEGRDVSSPELEAIRWFPMPKGHAGMTALTHSEPVFRAWPDSNAGISSTSRHWRRIHPLWICVDCSNCRCTQSSSGHSGIKSIWRQWPSRLG